MPERRRSSDATASAIIQSAWLSGGCLALVTGFGAGGKTVDATLISGRERMSLDVRYLDVGAVDDDDFALWLVGVEHVSLRAENRDVLRLTCGSTRLRVTGQELDAAIVPVAELTEWLCTEVDSEQRTRIGSFLASALDLVAHEDRKTVSDELFTVRQALRAPRRALSVTPGALLAVHVDRLLSVDDRAFFLDGWMRSTAGSVTRLTAVSPEGARVEILDGLCRSPRPDVVEFLGSQPANHGDGMQCLFELPAPSVRTAGWIFEVEDQRGDVCEVEAPPVVVDPLEVRRAILAIPALDRPLDEDVMSEHIHPWVVRVQRCLGAEPTVSSILKLGDPPSDPEVSIVVPIYRQISHLEAQLAEFADDSDVTGADLIYVLDSPEQAEELISRAADLYPIYHVPLRIAILEQNVGFAGACNAGAELARGRLLLLLNSDVLPDGPGWLTRMREFYDSTPNIGALGPKLLYEDDSIQHAGMYYHQLPGSSLWVDAHYFKGMHRSLPGANEARRVPLVSGACLMVDRHLYESIGGLPTAYIQGDYEDADFCLRLLKQGLGNWYLPLAELYHLEGQSYAPEVRRPLNRYNMWVHNHVWGATIGKLMHESSLPGLALNSS
jgi:GT2 family glycosyltransferase